MSQTQKVKRLRFVTTVPPKSEVRLVHDDTEVSFVPMEAIGENGEMQTDRRKRIGEVVNGYTYFGEGDVVLAKITPCFENGKGAIASRLVNRIGFGTTELHVLRAGRDLDSRFLFYVTRSHDFRKLGEAEMYGAGGQKRVPESFVRDFRAYVPSTREQREIADFLDRETVNIEELISLKRELIRAGDEQTSVVIERLVTKGQGLEALDAPGSVRLKFLLRSIEQGWSPQCDNSAAADGQWGVLKTGCVNGGRFDADENKALPAELEPIPLLEISAGDVLMSRANTKELLGSAAYVAFARPKLLLCDKLYRLRTRPEALDPEFLVLSLATSLSRHQLEREATGTSASMQNIGQDTVRNLPIPLVALPEQREVVEKARRIRADARALQQHVLQAMDALEEYRTALISAAVTGQIDVRNYRPQEAAALCQ